MYTLPFRFIRKTGRLSVAALMLSTGSFAQAAGPMANMPNGSGMSGMSGMSGLPDAPVAARQAAATAHVSVSDAWVRWLPGKLPAAGYMVLENTGDTAVSLLSAQSPDYADVMLHQTVRNGSTATMQMAGALPLPPHKPVAVAPGGYHFMLNNPTRPLTPGATIKLNLRFSDDTTLSIAAPLSPPTRSQ